MALLWFRKPFDSRLIHLIFQLDYLICLKAWCQYDHTFFPLRAQSVLTSSADLNNILHRASFPGRCMKPIKSRVRRHLLVVKVVCWCWCWYWLGPWRRLRNASNRRPATRSPKLSRWWSPRNFLIVPAGLAWLATLVLVPDDPKWRGRLVRLWATNTLQLERVHNCQESAFFVPATSSLGLASTGLAQLQQLQLNNFST